MEKAYGRLRGFREFSVDFDGRFREIKESQENFQRISRVQEDSDEICFVGNWVEFEGVFSRFKGFQDASVELHEVSDGFHGEIDKTYLNEPLILCE